MRATALDRRSWRLWTATALSNLGDGIRAAAFPLLAAATSLRMPSLAGGVLPLVVAWS